MQLSVYVCPIVPNNVVLPTVCSDPLGGYSYRRRQAYGGRSVGYNVWRIGIPR